jgi:hypothetical protein
MRNEILKMIETCVVPKEVLESPDLYKYYVEAVRVFKEAALKELPKYTPDQIIALYELHVERFDSYHVLKCKQIFAGCDQIILKKLAQALIVRRLEDVLCD